MTRTEYESKYGQPPQVGATAPIETQPEKRKGFGRKVAEFIAPTATRTYEKLKTGEDLTARDIAGSALEIGSFFVPVGATARGLGLAGKGALTLGRKIGLGAATGAIAGGTYEAGRAIGEEGTGVADVIGRTGRGLAFGGAFGGAIPAGIAGAKAIPGAIRAIPKAFQAAKRGVEVAGRGVVTGARAVTGLAQEGVETVSRRIPEKVGQFVERRAEQQARIKGKPAHVVEAVRKNIDQPIIDFVRNANPQDKIQRVKMLETAKKGIEDLSFQKQAKQIPGQTILQGPVKHLIMTKDIGIMQTKRVLEKLGNKPQNARPIFDQFVRDMAESGVAIDKSKLIPMRGSKIPEGDLRFYQQVLNELNPLKDGTVPLNFNQMHQLRQKWFEIARADKTFTSGPTSYARRMRSLLAQSLDQSSRGAYLKAQNKTREALEGLQEFVKFIGYKGNLENLSAKDLKAGEAFLRIFGNAADRPTSVLNKVYDTARKYGYKGGEDIVNQLRFADILEDVYGSTQTRALRGQVGRGVSDISDPLSRGLSAAREAAKWSPVSAALRLTRGFLSGTGDDTLKAFENLVRAEAGQKIPTVSGKGKTLKQVISPLIKEGKELLRPKAPGGGGNP